MGDIAFQCHSCSKNLAVGDRYIGVTFPCPDCQTELTVPAPSLVFPCPNCGAVTFAPAEIRGLVYGCPECETLYEVPQLSTIRCGACKVHLEIDDGDYAQFSGTDVECPQCTLPVPVPVLPTLAPPPAPPAPEESEVPPGDQVLIVCGSCETQIEMTSAVHAVKAGKLIRCPNCKGFFRVPETAQVKMDEPAPRAAQPPKAVDKGGGEFGKTMRMDSILENIPQAQALHEGRCLYCNRPVRQLDDHTVVCDHCQRVIRTVKRRPTGPRR